VSCELTTGGYSRSNTLGHGTLSITVIKSPKSNALEKSHEHRLKNAVRNCGRDARTLLLLAPFPGAIRNTASRVSVALIMGHSKPFTVCDKPLDITAQ
jgi:hypothetical protein